jgi:iron complex outermembrane receptor protein
MRSIFTLNPLASLLMGCGILTLNLPGIALAQEAAPGAAAPAPVKSSEVQEVIVTAQKVAQPASRTPISLTAISGEGLKEAGITDVRALTDVVPNVQISQERGVNQINIRGVMAVDLTERGDPSNAFHIDGVYIGRPEAQLGAFMDLDRVEVLRGPQGTLYGKNATGGAINVITNKPGFKREGKFTLDVGNYGALRTEAVANLPLSETVAARFAVSTTKHDTYLRAANQTEPLENQNDNAARGSLLWKISPGTTLLVSGERTTQGGIGFTPLPIRNFYDGLGLGSGITQALPDNILNPVYVDRGTDAALTMGGGPAWLRKTHKDNKHTMFRSELNSDLGWAALTYDFGYLKSKLDYEIAGPAAAGSPSGGGIIGFTKMPFRQASHELRLASPGAGALRWVAGVFYMNEDIAVRRQFLLDPPDTSPPLFSTTFGNRTENTSAAVFGQVTYSVLPATRITVGGRAGRDKKDFDPIDLATGASTGHREVTFRKNTFRVGLEQDLGKAVMAYASFSTGYKAGGFNDVNPTSPVIRPENLRAAEIGIKGRFLENRLQVSAAAYHYDYKDMQVKGVYCLSPISCGASITVNGNGAKMKGLEIEGRYRITPVDTLIFSGAHSDTEFVDFKSFNANGVQTWDVSGQELDRAPRNSFALQYTRDVDLASGASIKASLGTKYTGSYLNTSFSATDVFRYPQESFTKTDLTLTYTPAAGNYYLQAYVKNIENKVQVVNILQGAVNASTPRTFGMRLGANF